MNFTVPKQKKCRVCLTSFTPAKPMQVVCDWVCAADLSQINRAKADKKAAQVDRRETKAKLDAMVKKTVLVAKAQQAFNKFIKVRDAGKPCISCRRAISTEPNSHDAGHYRSVGSAVHMRFVEDNCHSQCKHCNRYLAGNHVAYRAGLIERIGLHSVEQIERDHTLRKYTREGLIEIAKHYNAEAKRLLEQR